jgi:hypothetical protein
VGFVIARVEVTPMAEAHQFYLEDSGARGDSGEVWTGTALANHFGSIAGLVVVGTGTQDRVPALIEVWDDEPTIDVAPHDHVGEASLEIHSGILVVSECQGDPRLAEIAVTPGWYRVRITCDGLDTADEDGHKDSYRCQLWLSPQAADRVVQWFEPWAPGPPPQNPYGLRVMSGATAWDERLKMRGAGVRSLPDGRNAFLYQDSAGGYWEYGWHGKTGTDLIEVPASEVRQYRPGVI